MKKQLTPLILTLGLLASTPLIYASNQETQDPKPATQSSADTASQDQPKPEHNMPPGKMGANTMGSGLPGNTPASTQTAHKKHKKSHKMSNGKKSPDNMPMGEKPMDSK